MQLLKQGIDSGWGSAEPFQVAGQHVAYDRLLQEAIDLFVTSGGPTGGCPQDRDQNSSDWTGVVCTAVRASAKRESRFGVGLQITQQHPPLPVAGYQCITYDFCEGLESTGGAKSEGPAAASSLDRSWASAETSLRLFPAQLQSLLQLRYERSANTPELFSQALFCNQSDLPAPLP